MKHSIKYLALLLLTGCQITVSKIPDPVNPDVAKLLSEHQQALEVLVKEYNLTHKKDEK